MGEKVYQHETVQGQIKGKFCRTRYCRAVDLHCRLEVEVGMNPEAKVGQEQSREMTSDVKVGMMSRVGG